MKDKTLFTLSVIAAVLSFMLLCLIVLQSCAAVDQYTGTKTYIATPQQISDIKTILSIENCPPGQSAVALTLQSNLGGATVTVRCQ